MSSNWQEALRQQGAQFSAERIDSFGDSTAECKAAVESSIRCPLVELTVLRITGTDSNEFLQGQFSNDVRKVDAEHHQLSSYCTPKGRILALFILAQQGDEYLLILPRELAEATLKRLRMFVMRSDVTIEDMGDELAVLGFSGSQAEGRLQELIGTLPASPGDSLSANNSLILHLSGNTPRYLLIAPQPRALELWQTSEAQTIAVGSEAWRLLDIRAGRPQVFSETVEAFVPQMLNLQHIDGVNFKKGCYPGQEVVARMQYLGKLKRRMYRAQMAADELPSPGQALFAAKSSSAQGAGKVVCAAHTSSGEVELLIVAEISSAEHDILRIESENGPQLTLLDLPYALENNNE